MKKIIVWYLLLASTACLVKIAPKEERSRFNIYSNRFRSILFDPITLSIKNLSKRHRYELHARLLARLIETISQNFESDLKVEIVPDLQSLELERLIIYAH